MYVEGFRVKHFNKIACNFKSVPPVVISFDISHVYHEVYMIITV